MSSSIRRGGAPALIALCCLLLAAFGGSPVTAQTASEGDPPRAPAAPVVVEESIAPVKPWHFSGTATAASDYRFRGVSFSNGKPVLQSQLILAHQSGFFVSVFGSTLPPSATYGQAEIDLIVGWLGEIAPGLTLDSMLLYYVFPDGKESLGGPSDSFETMHILSKTFGPAKVTVGGVYAWKQAALLNDDYYYVYSNIAVGVPGTPATLKGNIGYADGYYAFSSDNTRVDWMVGIDWALQENLTAGVSYVGSDSDSIDNVSDETVVFSLTARF